jgi:hypothetical protein
MTALSFALLAALQQSARPAAQQPALPPSPVARIVVRPAT